MDENLKAQIEALEKENLTYAVQLSEAMSARETQHGLWKEVKKEMQERIAELENQIKTYEIANARRYERIAELEKYNEELNGFLDERAKQLADLQTKLFATHSIAKIKELTAENERLKKEVTHLNHVIDECSYRKHARRVVSDLESKLKLATDALEIVRIRLTEPFGLSTDKPLDTIIGETLAKVKR